MDQLYPQARPSAISKPVFLTVESVVKICYAEYTCSRGPSKDRPQHRREPWGHRGIFSGQEGKILLLFFSAILRSHLEKEVMMSSRKNEVCAVAEMQLKDQKVSVVIGSEMNRLAVGDLILDGQSSEQDRAAMKAWLMKHPKASIVDMIFDLVISARGKQT
jgi:hypothetical protein